MFIFYSEITVYLLASRKHSYLRKESPTEVILLAFVLDKTASGMARSNTENGLHGWSAPHFCMGQDFLWDSEEQNLCVAPHCPRGDFVPY